ncbi:pentatricopeptide repeat-containing protein At4g19191, mitochondrial [Silene latifolia]|uniref:pentatricopeptide repeat-containing protein At4g19191, mitochondrial n=1 Tax=Silene latifolia TaxID=37657 RepID=UPI003D77B080
MIRPLHWLLKQIPKCQTVGQWNTYIREAVNKGNSKEALIFYRQMKQMGLSPNKLTFPFVAKACAKISNFTQSQIIHADILKLPFWSDVFIGTALINMYVKSNQLEFAHRVFDKMPERDVTSWNAMMLGFAQSDFVGRFFLLFREMRLLGVVPDSVTLIGLTQSATKISDLPLVKGAHALGVRVGLMDDISLVNTFISGYGKSGDLLSSVGMFDEIHFESRTIVSWNALIGAHSLLGTYCSAFRIYQLVLDDGRKPDVSTFLSLLSSCGELEALNYGKLVHSHAIQLGVVYDVTMANTLLTMYSRCGDIHSASLLFQRMAYKTCVSWTAMIGGYAEKGNIDEAFNLFLAMQMAGEKPDTVTLLSLLSGCGQTGSLELGIWIDNYAISNRLRDNVILCNAIIDMYAKCGFVDKCKELFNSMPHKTIVSWTTMISGLALNGEFTESLNLFFRMVGLGLKPNHVTFLTILQACTHAGFLEKGRECFDLMTQVYRLSPWLEHYSCMVDLLGRRGKLKEALELIESMPLKPDPGIWGTLLAACKIHHNLKIGEYAANLLYELEPHAAASYVELANMYALEGQWDEVSKVRGLMKSNEVKKSPGQSIIQVNGKNHTFSVEERSHPEGLQIYEVLHLLAGQLKEDPFSYIIQVFPENEMGLQLFLEA